MATCPLCSKADAQELGPLKDRDSILYECRRCGKYVLDGLTRVGIQDNFGDQLYLLSAVTRRATDRGEPPVDIANDDTIRQLISSAPRWRTLLDGIDRVLLLFASRVKRFRDSVHFDPSIDYPAVCCRDGWEMTELVQFMQQRGYYRESGSEITLNGWSRIDELHVTSTTSTLAFVAMSFDADLTSAWASGLVPGINDTGYFVAERVDSQPHNDKIDDRIVAMIRKAGLVVADFTLNNLGVYYEAGLAHGFGVPVVRTVRRDWIEKVHFDTRQYSHIVWETPADLGSQLTERLNATVVPRDRLQR